MATAYYAPGVYIEEPDRGTKPIEGVSTSVTAFIGFTEKAEAEIENKRPMRRSILSEAKTVTNWSQYQHYFGGLVEGAYLPYAVRGFFENGGVRCYIISVRTLGEPMRAQALIEAEDPKTKKSVPCLYIRAKKGGPLGQQISVELDAKDPPAASTGQSHNALQTLKLTINYLEQTIEQKKSTREEEVDDVDATGKPILDATTGQPKKKKTRVEVLEDVVTETKKSTSIDNVTLRQLPSWDYRERNLENGGVVNALDRDLASNKDEVAKAKNIYEQLSNAGVEVFRGVETNIPVRVKLKRSLAQLTIDGSAFNVDVDDKLLIADVDKNELTAAKKAGKRFEIVRPEQFRGYGRKGITALEELDDVNLLCAPDVMSLWGPDQADQDRVLTIQKMMVEHCQQMQFRFAILDCPPGKDVDSIKQWRLDAAFDPQHGHAAVYYPWFKIDDPLNPGRRMALPPSGHIAGIYARSDTQRGVHKAPANETVAGIIDLELNVNRAEQEMLNPIGINCIRKFPGRGIRVWGARTLALTDASWRYINVRRVFNYVEASIERATQWVVFEPNDPILWGKVRRDVNAFLRTVWLSGALFGNTPDEAYYVKCDAELNPSETRDLGYLFIEIGMAPVKPAEFVVFRISQWAGPNAEG